MKRLKSKRRESKNWKGNNPMCNDEENYAERLLDVTKLVQRFQTARRLARFNPHRDIAINSDVHACKLQQSTGMRSLSQFQHTRRRNRVRATRIESTLRKDSKHSQPIFGGFGPLPESPRRRFDDNRLYHQFIFTSDLRP